MANRRVELEMLDAKGFETKWYDENNVLRPNDELFQFSRRKNDNSPKFDVVVAANWNTVTTVKLHKFERKGLRLNQWTRTLLIYVDGAEFASLDFDKDNTRYNDVTLRHKKGNGSLRHIVKSVMVVTRGIAVETIDPVFEEMP